jgi:hypothetical protein
VVQGPVENAEGGQSADDHADALHQEQFPLRDLKY